MRNKKNLSTILLASFLILFAFASACKAAEDYGTYTYLLHINYDGSKATVSSNPAEAYDVVAEDMPDQSGPLSGSVYDFNGNKLADFSYTLTTGKNDIYAPHFDNAKQIVINTPSTSIRSAPSPLVISVAASAVCNENKVCDQAAGETSQNCPSDCKVPVTSSTGNTTQAASKTAGSITPYVLLAAGAILMGGVGLWYFKKSKNID